MNTPLISVIIPAYNVSPYIKRAVESLLNQTYKNIEIIIVNDGSQDDTETTVKKLYSEISGVKIINQRNAGVSHARINGFSQSSGEWIGFCDADDYVEPEMFEKLLNNALQYNADISHCGYTSIRDTSISYCYGSGKKIQADKGHGIQMLLSGKQVESSLNTKIFKRDLMIQLLNEEKMDYSLRNCEDLLMNYYLFSYANKSIYEDICPYHYISREGSASRRDVDLKKLMDPIIVFKKICQNERKKLYTFSLALERLVYSQIALNNAPKYIFTDDRSLSVRENTRLHLKTEIKRYKNILSKKLIVLTKLSLFSPIFYKLFRKLNSLIHRMR